MDEVKDGNQSQEAVEPEGVAPAEQANDEGGQASEAVTSELEALKVKLVEAQEEAKAHQRNTSSKDLELKKFQGIQDKLDDLSSQVETFSAILPELGKANSDSFDGDKSAHIQQALSKQKAETFRTAFTRYDGEIDKLLVGTGLTKESPELEVARVYWNSGAKSGDVSDLRKAVQYASEVAGKQKPKEEAVPTEDSDAKIQETIEKRVNELVNEKLAKSGLFKQDDGIAGGKTPDADFKSKFAKGELPVNKENIKRYNDIIDAY